MIFTIGSVEDAKAAAISAESVGGNYVKVPGAYVGPITSASFKKFDSGAGGLEIEVAIPQTETETEKTLKFMIITLTKAGVSTYTKDGKKFPLMGMNLITGGLLPVVRMKTIESVDDGDGKTIYPSLIGKKIGCLINIRLSNGNGKNKSKVYENPALVGFYDPISGKTGSEILNNTEAKKKAKIESTLKIVDDTTTKVADATDSSDPFGDSTGGSDKEEDLFADNSKEETTPDLPETVSEKVVKEVVEKEVTKEVVKEVAKEVAKEEPKVDVAASSDENADNFWEE